tara:strand:- start:8117 stop:9226 length:1110 start_codon:yes stop_codon:yes gene_type:complete
MKKIKVLHIVHDFLQGGIESFLYYLSEEQLTNENLQVEILCLQDKDKVTNKRISIGNVHCHYIAIKPNDLSINKYRNILKLTNEFDILHFHTFKPLLSFFLHFSKAKKVFTVHSAGDVFRPNSFNFKFKNKLFEILLNKSMDVIAHNSKYTKEYWLNRGVKSKNNVVVYNGVPAVKKHTKENVFALYPALKDTFLIGTTSRFIPWKRIEILIEAFSMSKYKNEMKLVLVGEGPIKSTLEALVTKLGIQDSVVFTGYRPNVTDFQAALDVCVFPSVSEPFGLVAIECLLLGKPVFVMNDGGGITELIEDVEPQNIAKSVEDLAKLFDKAYEDQEISKLNASKRIHAAQKYSVNNTEKEYAKLYQKTIHNV